MFVLVCILILLSNYILVADLSDSYKVGYFVALILVTALIGFLKII